MQDADLGLAAANAYVNTVNDGRYSEMAGLFSSDAILSPADGKTYKGSKEISGFYSRSLNAATPRLRVAAAATVGNTCLFLIQAAVGNDYVESVNVFEFNESGLIEHLRVFLSAATVQLMAKASA